MRSRFAPLLAVSLLVASAPALAEEDLVGNGLSLYSGRTLGTGNNVIAPEIGWPGIDVTFAHGMSPGFDLGGKFTFNYGYEFAVGVYPAINAQAVLRFHLLTQGIFALALETEPGIGVGFVPFNFLIYLPVALQMSVHPLPSLSVLFGAEFRPSIGIGQVVSFGMPILLLNPGLEYAVGNRVALTLRTGFGPSIGAGGVFFTFRALMGATIKI
jgi:hypothetical protein